jgi:dienelactone hydrolase
MTKTIVLALVAATLLSGRASGQVAPTGDAWLRRPVDDRTFRAYLEFFGYDQRLPFDTDAGDTVQLGGARREHVSFQSTAGTRVTAFYYRAAEGGRLGSGVVLLHGGGAGGKDGAGARFIAELIARAGIDVLSIDMPHFGERSDGLFTTFAEAEKHDRLYNQPPAYLAWVTQIVKDVGRSVDWLVAERGVDARRIGIVGVSRGAVLASIVGGADRRLAVVVLSYGGHFDALENGHLPAACPANYIGRISPRPLLMINGTQDNDFVRAASVEPLYRLARSPREIVWEEAGHRGVPAPEHQGAMLEWLREHLR